MALINAPRFKLVVAMLVKKPNLTFNNPEEEAFRKHCGKRRKCWLPTFSPFPTIFSTLSKIEIIILPTADSSSADALNFVLSKNVLLHNELNVLEAKGNNANRGLLNRHIQYIF